MCSFQQFPIEYLEIPEDLTTEEDLFEFEHTYIVPRENLTVNITSLRMTVVLTGISSLLFTWGVYRQSTISNFVSIYK